VLGREFPSGLIKHVAGKSDDELEQMLAALQLGEFIYEQPAIPDIEYQFKHALTQEVAYNSVLIERRKLLHERAGQSIESLYADRLEDCLPELAHHYERGGNLPKAVEYLGRAGVRASQQSAYPEAVVYLTRALEMLQQLPHSADRDRQELDLLLILGWSLWVTDPESAGRETVLVRARELGQQVGNNAKLMEALLALAHLRFLRGERGLARELAEDVIALAEQANAPATLAAAHSALGLALLGDWHNEPAREHFERAIELFGPGPFRNFGEAYFAQLAAGMLAAALLALGYPSTALARKRESLAAARQRADPFSIFAALFIGAMNHLSLRDSRTALEHAEEMLSIATEHGMRYQQETRFFHGWAMSVTGRGKEGIAEMIQAISELRDRPRQPTVAMLATLAESCGRNGLPEEGLEAVAQGMGLEQTHIELHRVKGELLLAREPPEEAAAERCFRTAIDFARSQKARLFELRATTSLARLLNRQGKRDEACAMLSEIYGWFTEGFEFTDLKDAKALLDELGS
jgi:tetratricopeptide (TPR) repeat protein